jgi:hypothetical protein
MFRLVRQGQVCAAHCRRTALHDTWHPRCSDLRRCKLASRLFVIFVHLGGFGLLALGVLDSSFLVMPLGNDLLVIALTARNHGAMLYYAAIATSTLDVQTPLAGAGAPRSAGIRPSMPLGIRVALIFVDA